MHGKTDDCIEHGTVALMSSTWRKLEKITEQKSKAMALSVAVAEIIERGELK